MGQKVGPRARSSLDAPCISQTLREIQRAAAEGHKYFKMHTCAHHCVIEQTRAAEEVAPDGFKVHYDFNHNRTETDTLRIIDEVERSSVVGILRPHPLAKHRRLATAARTHFSPPTHARAPAGRRRGNTQRLRRFIHGGRSRYWHFFPTRFCRGNGRAVTVIQLTGGTLSKALAIHLGAVLPNVSHSVNLDDQYAEDATGGRLEIDEGSTPVPKGPGLGIDIDQEKLAELAARPKSELPTHVGVLELPAGSTYYTPSIPSAEISAASQKATSAAFAAACGTTMDQRISRPPSNESRAKGHSRHVHWGAPVQQLGALPIKIKSTNRPA